MQAGFGAVQSALSLIQALEQGNTFSATLAGVSMLNQMMSAGGVNLPPELASLAGPLRNIGSGLGAVSAAMNLADAIKNGDALGILQSWANLGAQGINLYASMEGLKLFDAAGNATGTLGTVAQDLGVVGAGVGLVMAIQSGNSVSMVSSSLSLMSAMGVIGPYGAVAAVIISLVSSMFGSDQPMLEGQAQAVWDAAGNTHVVTTQDNEGGGATATGWMNNLVSGLQSQLAGMVDANGQPLYGLVTPRLPSVGYQYDPDGFNLANGAKGHLYLKWVDENGQEQTRYYDGAGSRGDGTGETLVGDFMKRAMEAVVPAWEAETVRQHFLQDGVSAAARPGERAGMPVEDAQHLTQRFTALSFPAVAAPGAAANAAVYVDIDGDGYLEKTDWISANQGMLAIDLNGDGKIGAGELLNLDPGSTLERNSLRWLDANWDGVLDARDPAFAALKVWIDANHDGLSQTATATSAGELQSMAAAGIVAINFASNPPVLVKADGSTVALNVQQLTGDVKGVVYMMTVGGLLESQEGGETVLHAINTRQFDGQKEHTHGGDLARESGHAHIDAGNGALISTTAQTISSTSDRSDTTIGTSDRRLVSGPVGATLAGQVGAAQAAVRTSASQVRETPVTFLPGGATTADQQLRQVRQDMIRNADSSLFGLGGGSGAPLVAVALAAAATQWPALAVAAPQQVLLPSGTGISASAASDNAMAVLATATSGALGIEHPRRPVMGVLLPGYIVNAGAPKTDVAVQAPEAVVLRLHDAQVTAREIVGATSSIRVSREIYSEALPEVAANTPTTPGVVLDYPTVFGERIEGSEDIGLRLAETLLLANDAAINASAFPDQQPLRITAVFGSVHGQVSLSNTADGKTEIIFIPDLNYHGPASFDYTVTDQYGLSSHGSTSLLIAPVNDAPVVQNEFSVDGEDETLVLRTSDLLANDFDVDSVVDGDRLSVTRVGQAQHGQVVLGDDGLIRYLPDQDYHGPAQFTYWVGDRDPEQLSVHGGVGLETPGTVSLTINPINDAPVVGNETASGDEDATLVFRVADLLANDSDVDTASDGDVLRITRVGWAQHGQVSLVGETIRFVPDQDYNGPAQFDYWVADRDPVQLAHNGGEGIETVGTVYLSITPVNDAPVVQDEQAVGDEDHTLLFRVADLLANDTDVDSLINGDVLRITRVGQAQHGQVVLGDDGMIAFAPDPDYHGAARFTYWVGDRNSSELAAHGGAGLETPGTVSLTINPINDAPVVGNETASGDEDRTLVFRVADLLANDADVDTGSDGDVLRITRVGRAQHGQVSLVGETIRFVPDQDYNGPAQFDYWVADRDPAQLAHNGGEGIETVGTVHLNITPVNDAPVVQGEQAAGDEDHTLLFRLADLLTNDTDVDSLINGDVLRITRVGQAQHGQVVLGEDATIRFIPDRDYNGPAQFTYWVADRDPANLLNNGGDGFEIAGTMVLTIQPVNDLPVVTGEHIDSDEDVVLEIDQSRLLANDTDVDVASNAQVLRISAVSNAQHGVVELWEDGKVRFFPERDFVGAASFSYTVDDGNGGRVLGTTMITLAPVNDAPEVRGETIIFDEDVAQNIASALLLANDSDVDNQHSDLRIVSVDNATHGAVALDPDGGIHFRPEPDYFGMAVFTYTVSDGVGGFTVGTASLQINPVNDAPRLIGERATIDEDQSAHFVVGALLENDYDVDNTHGDLHISSAGNASHGTARLSDGEIVFVPDLNYFGPASFTYVVDDGVGGKSQARVDLQFNAVNDAPVVNDELINGKRNLSYTLTQASLLANDTDVEDPHSLALMAVRAPMHGVVTLNANGTITFVPENNYAGVGGFEYVVRDPGGAESIGTARIDFSRVNVNPVAVDDSFAGFEDTAFVIPPAQLLVNDKDPDATSTSLLSVTAVSNPANGTVSLQADGSIRFTPAQDYYGSASFRYQVSDGEGGNTWATAYLNVQGVNDAPVIEDVWYGRPIYGYRWGQYFSASYASTVPVNDQDTAIALASNPNDVVSGSDGSTRSNDLMDVFGNVIGLSFYRSGQLRPLEIDSIDAFDPAEEITYEEAAVDDITRQNGKVIAYDPDGGSDRLSFSVLNQPQHGHAWANQYTDTSRWSYILHTDAAAYAIHETGAWQYYSHRGDPYSGADPFTIRVGDEQGGSVDAIISTVHAGSSAGGGGGGKCPIIVDLDGDGIELIRPEDSHMFADLNGNGWRERIGWASTDDGILAFDANHDGQINEEKEISFVSYKKGAQTDLEGLAAFDIDGDGKISSRDGLWSSFGILRDLNKNGVQDAGEFILLDQMGITAIGLQRHGTAEINNGNVVFGTSDVWLSDGRTTQAGDVMFGGEVSLFPEAANAALAAAHPAARGGDGEPAIEAGETRSPSSSAVTAHAARELAPSPEQIAMDELAAIRQMALIFSQMVATSPSSPGEALSFAPSADHSLAMPGSEMLATVIGSSNDPSVHVPVPH